jgi:acetyl/propionyl-CoA carboxylase alpha subunit
LPYIVKIDDRDFKVDIERSGSTYRVLLDGKALEAEVILPNRHEGILVIGNRSYTIAMGSDNSIIVNGEGYSVQVFDEMLLKLLKSGGETVQKKEVVLCAPMPGLVIEVEVKEGDQVKNGQGMVIVEAMKMQNEMKAPRDGVVKKVLVQKGQTVNGKDPLVIIE